MFWHLPQFLLYCTTVFIVQAFHFFSSIYPKIYFLRLLRIWSFPWFPSRYVCCSCIRRLLIFMYFVPCYFAELFVTCICLLVECLVSFICRIKILGYTLTISFPIGISTDCFFCLTTLAKTKRNIEQEFREWGSSLFLI